VVNIASIHALVASPFKSGYITAKHGLVGLTRTAALEGGEHGITVNAICPAYVRTPLVEGQIASQASAHHLSPEEVVEKILRHLKIWDPPTGPPFEPELKDTVYDN
jgi:3-hydroxybutyrate dehydrogenase